jgi:rhodanese-related sulfurtransferase
MITLLTIVGLVVFPAGYWSAFLNVPSVKPETARERMAEHQEDSILIDVRTESEYRNFSLKEAVHIPLHDVMRGELASWKSVLENKAFLFVICNTGFQSAQATEGLRRAGYARTFNVEGGIDAWLASVDKGSRVKEIGVNTAQGETNGVPRLTFSWVEQVVICLTAFGLKPLYEILSLVLVFLLWSSRDRDLVALRRAMIAFFLGETACAVNYLFFDDLSLLMEFFHMYGMLVCFGLASFAFLKALDMRVCHFTDAERRCALLSLCENCYKYRPVTCNLRWLFLFAVPATAMLALMPLSGDLGSYRFVGEVFGQDVVFSHPLSYQYFEIRFFPVISLVFFLASFVILVRRKEEGMAGAKVYFSAGLGALGFSLMRFMIFWTYSKNPLWANAWEEITEFLFISFTLWIVLRGKRGTLRKAGVYMGSLMPVRQRQRK